MHANFQPQPHGAIADNPYSQDVTLPGGVQEAGRCSRPDMIGTIGEPIGMRLKLR